MPTRAKAIEAGIFDEAELDFLSRVMKKSEKPGETEEDREHRASRIISYYQTGIRDEDELVALAAQPLGR